MHEVLHKEDLGDQVSRIVVNSLEDWSLHAVVKSKVWFHACLFSIRKGTLGKRAKSSHIENKQSVFVSEHCQEAIPNFNVQNLAWIYF